MTTPFKKPQGSIVNLFNTNHAECSSSEIEDEEAVVLDMIPAVNMDKSTDNRTCNKKKQKNPKDTRNRVLVNLSRKEDSPPKKDNSQRLKGSKDSRGPTVLIDLTDDGNDNDIETDTNDIEFIEELIIEKEKIHIDLTDDSVLENNSQKENSPSTSKSPRHSNSHLEDTSVTQKEAQPVGEKPSTSESKQSDDKPGIKLSKEESLSLVKKSINKPDPEELCVLYVGQLDDKTNKESLRNYFQKWGTLLDAVVINDPDTNRSKHYGFVTYTHQHMVDNVQKNRPHIVDGRLVCCRRRLPLKARSLPVGLVTKLFLFSIREGIKEKDLKDYFEQFGEILNCRIISQAGSRRFGFITFSDYDSVDKILVLKGHTIKGQYIEPQVSLTREQLAERQLKFYLKYFGGFNDWPMAAIENYIRSNPDLRNIDTRIPKPPIQGNNYSQYSYEGLWVDGRYNYRQIYEESGSGHNSRVGPVRNNSLTGRYSPYDVPAVSESVQYRQASRAYEYAHTSRDFEYPHTSRDQADYVIMDKMKREDSFHSDNEDGMVYFVKNE